MNARQRVRVLVVLAAFLVVTPQLIGAKVKRAGDRPSHEPQRLLSLSENGPIVTLKLENGTSVDVASSNVKIKNEAREVGGTTADVKTHAKGRKKEQALSVAQLSQMSAANPAGLPAVVSLSYKKGTVKKAKIRMFASESALNAFLAARAERVAAGRAAAQTKEPHR